MDPQQPARTEARPVRVILLCGPAGSGKSHLARSLASDGVVRLSLDELAWQEGLRHHPLSERELTRLHALLVQRLLATVAEGHDVVVDAAFWSRRLRGRYRALPYPRAVEVETWYVRTPEEVLRERVAARTNSGPDDIALTQEVLTGFLTGFEVPTPQEGPMRVIDGAGRKSG